MVPGWWNLQPSPMKRQENVENSIHLHEVLMVPAVNLQGCMLKIPWKKKECHSSWTNSWAKKKAPADRKHAGAGIQKQCPTRMVLHLMSLNRRLAFSSLPWLWISTTPPNWGPIIEIRWPNDGHQPTNEILVPSDSWHETSKPKFSPSCFWQWPSPFFSKASLTKRGVWDWRVFCGAGGRKTSSVHELVNSESSVLFWGWIY